jgi:membrane protease YdiL (CAAX protease family)
MLGAGGKRYSVRARVKDQDLQSTRLPAPYVLAMFLALVLGGAIVLGPPLYFAVSGWFPVSFHRAMNRALAISALAALGFFWRRISWSRLWPLGWRAWRQLAFGYLLAFVSAQAMIGLDLAARGFTSSHLSDHQIALRLLLSLTAALVVPPLEETLFRGFLQVEWIEALGRRGGWVTAAAIFMLAHFLKVPEGLDHSPVHLWSGATALGDVFSHGAWALLQDARGLNLFLIGLILGGVFLRAGSLWINAGLHSGWIFVLLLFSGLTRPVVPPHVSFLGHGDILSSPATSLVLVMLGVWLWRFYPPPSSPPESGENAP